MLKNGLSSKKNPTLWDVINDMKLKSFNVKNEENFIAFHYEHEWTMLFSLNSNIELPRAWNWIGKSLYVNSYHNKER